VRYEPWVVCFHVGGASAPRPALLPVQTASRLRYARKHHGRATAALARLGIALGALTHVVLTSGGRPSRAGFARALRVTLSG
jgi:hypothetical protein